MARHRVIPFERHALHPELQRVVPPDDPNYPAIRRRMFVTYAKTIAGYLAMVGLCVAAGWYFGFSWKTIGWGGLVSLVLPVVAWWFCDKIALFMSKAVPADPNNPDHARVQRCVDKAYEASDMKYKPRLYASPDTSPNAFATGPIHRKAVVAFTQGLLNIGLTDDEITGVFAHELGHVRNYDVGINSLLAILSSLFSMIVQGGISAWLGVLTGGRLLIMLGTLAALKAVFGFSWVALAVTALVMLYPAISRVLRGKAADPKAIPPFAITILTYVIYWVIGQFTKLIQMFVVRSRESGADATGSYITGKPCDLANALLKLAAWVEKNRPKQGTEQFAVYQSLRPVMIIDPLFDTTVVEAAPTGIWGRIKRFWKYLQLTHPPVPERVVELERMNGGACPRT